MLFDFDEKPNYEEMNLLNKEGKNGPEKGVKFATTIGESNVVTGSLEGSTPICVNGTLKGNINSTGYVFVSKTGHVEGDVKANQLVITGEVTGQSIEVDKLHITVSGVLNGDLKAGRLVVEEGGVINGNVAVVPSKAPVIDPPVEEPEPPAPAPAPAPTGRRR